MVFEDAEGEGNGRGDGAEGDFVVLTDVCTGCLCQLSLRFSRKGVRTDDEDILYED